MNDETENRDTNTRVRHIKGGPGIRVRHVQIENQKIDDMTVQQPVGEISEDSGEQQRKGNITPNIGDAVTAKEQDQDNDQSEAR